MNVLAFPATDLARSLAERAVPATVRGAGRPLSLNDKDSPWMADYRKKMERRYWVARRHGNDTAEFFDAVQKEGLSIEGDEKKIQKLAESTANDFAAHSSHIVTCVGSDGQGGIEATISLDARAHKEKGINAAIKSLGDRTGDDPGAISEDLMKALRERGLGLGDDLRMNLASSLSTGEEVVVGVDSD